jgi:lipopolysaccharide transport system ATP-binding protein
MSTSIKVENLSKIYRIGEIGTGTISRDMERWFARLRGKEDPFLKIGQTNDRSKKGDSNIVYSLQDINFEIVQGDAVGIIGRNGAGKSTLLKILSRVTSPTTGKINIKGRAASLLEVGTGFHPELTGRENIFLNGAILGMRKKEIQRKLDEIIDFSGVERYIDTPVKRYSSGMYVRLAFAVAAHLESEILIVDEVLAVGDAEFQRKCLGKMGEISKGDGRTVLFVSHNMSAVSGLCNKGIVLKNGTVQFSGAIQQSVQNYLQQYNEEVRHVKYTTDNSPGNEYAKLIEVLVKTSSDEDSLRVNNELEIHFKLDIAPNIANDFIDLTFHLHDELNNLVFVGSTGMNEDTRGKYRGKAICIVPANLMNIGIYNIKHVLLIRNAGQSLVRFNDVIQFEIIEKQKQHLGWNGSKEGVVRPMLKWKNL